MSKPADSSPPSPCRTAFRPHLRALLVRVQSEHPDPAAARCGQSFQQFAEAVQTRFGRAVERTGTLVEGRPPSHWLEWQDATTRLRAIDHTTFYGFYCLVFEDKATLAQLPTLRTATQARDDGSHAMVDSILRGDGEGSHEGGSGGADTHADIVDRLTGTIRRRTDAPEASSGSSSSGSSSSGSSSGSSSSGSSSSGSSSGSRSRPDDDDPFAGMDL